MTPMTKKYPLWSLFYEDDGYNINGKKLMGRQAAGWSFLKALVSNSDHLSVYLKDPDQKQLLIDRIKPLLSNDQKLNLNTINYTEPYKSAEYGGIFYPGPGINELASHRSYFGHDTYSIVGITHTTASHSVMSSLSSLLFSDAMPWDAIICTSDCVLDTVNKIIDHRQDRLSSKFSIKNPIYPKFPVIPLGLNKNEFDFSESFKKKSRDDLDIKDGDIVLVYVGRLSFHAKAHHLPMYLSLEQCAKDLSDGKKIHIIQTGWFANDFVKDTFVEEGKKICPSIKFHFLDGKDQGNKFKTLAAGDIFISLSDNIQETFGLTPLEGMASGLPVIVSDWNGYKSTVRDNIDGFRVKTYALEAGYSEDIAYNHMMDFINYDHYIGMSVQRVAVDIPDCINKLKILIGDANLRKTFGDSGKRRVNEVFDWPVILNQYRDLSDELDSIRLSENKNYSKFCSLSLPSDKLDPFFTFSSYPTETLNENHIFSKNSNINMVPIKDIIDFGSINYSKNYLPHEDDILKVYNSFNKVSKLSSKKIMSLVNLDKGIVLKSLIWLIKFGYVVIENKNV